MARTHVLFPHGTELLLAGGVQDYREREKGLQWDRGFTSYSQEPPSPATLPPTLRPLPPSLSSRAGTPSTVQIFV